MIFNQQTSVYHPFDGQNPQQEKGGALLFLCAPGEIWTRYGRPWVPYNHARPKRGLIHQDRESSIIRPLLYLQATTAGY